MPNIFNFMNYRDYLRAFYFEKKGSDKGFSYQVMAESAGFSSKSFIKLVIDEKRTLLPNLRYG